jgi:small-conductance mechanosensitive channel
MWESTVKAFVETAVLFAPRILVSLVIFTLFWAAGIAIYRIIMRLPRMRRVPIELTILLARSAKLTLLAVGAVTALGNLDIHVTALVAGLGLTGFAAGFAFKDIISNALSGILLILSRPFGQGDAITVVSTVPLSGKVVDINLRYTVLDTSEATVFIPNSILFTNPVTVKGTNRRQPLIVDHAAAFDRSAATSAGS